MMMMTMMMTMTMTMTMTTTIMMMMMLTCCPYIQWLSFYLQLAGKYSRYYSKLSDQTLCNKNYDIMRTQYSRH